MRDRLKFYTTQRVSKRLTITEDNFHLAKKSSERISLASRWVVHQVRVHSTIGTCSWLLLRLRKHLTITTLSTMAWVGR